MEWKTEGNKKKKERKINESKGWLRINKIDKPAARPIKKKERRHKSPILGMRKVTPLQILQILKG